MKAIDIARFAWRSLTAYRSRTLLIVLAMSIGVGAVVVLTSLVEGSTVELEALWRLHVAQGQFLPAMDPRRAAAVCVLGAKVRNELFGAQSAIGELVRIGDRRFRVVGVLQQQGEFLGIDIDEL